MWALSCICIGIPIACLTFQWAFEISRRDIVRNGCDIYVCCIGAAILLWIVLYCFGATFGIVLCEIVGFAPFAGYMFIVEHNRHMNGSTSKYAKIAFDFIFDNKSLYQTIESATSTAVVKDNTKQQQQHEQDGTGMNQELKFEPNAVMAVKNKVLLSKDEQLFRLIFINYCWIGYFRFASDKILIKYLNKNIDNQWSNVTLSSLGANTHYDEVQEDHKFLNLTSLFTASYKIFPKEMKKKLSKAMNDNGPCKDCYILWHKFCVFYVYFMLYVFFPLFVLSRLFSIFFPLIAMIYFNFDIKSIQLLQWILTILHTIFVCAWIIAAIRCFRFYRVTMQLFPGLNYWSVNGGFITTNGQEKRLNLMQKYYNQRINEKFIYDQSRKIVIEILGKDIGGLIVSFWPKFDLGQWLQDLKQDMQTQKLMSPHAH